MATPTIRQTACSVDLKAQTQRWQRQSRRQYAQICIFGNLWLLRGPHEMKYLKPKWWITTLKIYHIFVCLYLYYVMSQFLLLFFYIYLCTDTRMSTTTFMWESEDNLQEVGSLYLSFRSWGSNLAFLAWWQAPSPIDWAILQASRAVILKRAHLTIYENTLANVISLGRCTANGQKESVNNYL